MTSPECGWYSCGKIRLFSAGSSTCKVNTKISGTLLMSGYLDKHCKCNPLLNIGISMCRVFFWMTLCLRLTWSDNKVRELIAVKVLHTSLLNTIVVAVKVLPLGSYSPIPAPSQPFKTILELVLWNGLQSCRCITPDVINVIKMPSFQYFLYLREQKKVTGG